MHRGGRVAVHEDKGRYHRRPLFRRPPRADEALVLDVVDLEVLPHEGPAQKLEAPRPEVPLVVRRPRRPDDRADDLLVGGLCLVDDAGGPLWLLGHLCFVWQSFFGSPHSELSAASCAGLAADSCSCAVPSSLGVGDRSRRRAACSNARFAIITSLPYVLVSYRR